MFILLWTCSVSATATINVLLKKVTESEQAAWTINAPSWTITTLTGPLHKKTVTEPIRITSKNNQVFINNKRLRTPLPLVFEPSGETFTLNDIEYHGSLRLIEHNGALLLINRLPLEEYIFCVLHTESWPGWPLEVNKVFAIASRSYVLAKKVEARSMGKPFDILDTNKHQTYGGLKTRTQKEEAVLRQAVDETEGVILAYQKKPILAMFDCCCGGVKTADIHHVNHKVAPYLARKEVCTYCKNCKLYSWKKEYDATWLTKLLKEQFKSFGNLQSIAVTKRDKAGLTQEITIRDQRKSYTVDRSTFKGLVSDLKSFCYDATLRGGRGNKKIVIEGKGYGHHVGLCQWGARAMIDKGFLHKDILLFYYPGTTFMKLK